MEPNLDEMAIAESRLAASDSAPTGEPRAVAAMDIDLDEGPIEEHVEKGDEGGASMNVAIEEREVETAVLSGVESAPAIARADVPVVLQAQVPPLEEINAAMTDIGPQTSNVRAQSPQSRPEQAASASRDADPLSEIANLIQEAQRDHPAPEDAAEMMLELSTRTVVTVERIDAVTQVGPEAREELVEATVERVEDRASLSIPLQRASASPSLPEARRPGPTLSSLAALSVSPFASGGELPQVDQLPVPPVQVPNAQPAVPDSAPSVNPPSAQVNTIVPAAQLSAATTIPTEYADGETDDAEGETDPGEDVFQTRATGSDAEEEAMNGATAVRPGDPGFTDYLYRAPAKNKERGRGRGRGTATASRGAAIASRGSARPRATGPKIQIVEVVLQKYKRLKFKPTANDDVATMLRAPLGLGADDPINPDLAFAPASQVIASASTSGSRSASILPPPPMIDPALMDMPDAGEDGQKQKDQRHRNYDSDEDHAGKRATTFAPKQPRKRVLKPRATANAIVGASRASVPGSSTIQASAVPATVPDGVPAETNNSPAGVPAPAGAASSDLPDVQISDAEQSPANLDQILAEITPPETEAAAAAEQDQAVTSAQAGTVQPTVNGTTSNRPKAKKRPKKAEQDINEAILSLVSDNEQPIETATQAEAEAPPTKPKKPRKSKAQKEAEAAAAEAAVPPQPEPEPEPVVPVLAPRRKLKMEQTWFNPDELPTAVPYPLRYYISPNDGQPIVSWREPDESDAHSNRPEGTLYENGTRVNPAGSVDKPEDRRANTACEFCKFSVAKCDGYGDRPCSTCLRNKRPVCMYKPWTLEEQLEYEDDLERGYKQSQVDPTANGRDSRRAKQREPPPAELDMTAQDETVVQSMTMADPAEIQRAQPQVEVLPVAPKVHKARKPKMKSQILAPASLEPSPDSADGVADILEVVIDLDDDVEKEKETETEKPKAKRPKTAKRKKIEEQPAPVVEVVKPMPADGTIRRRKMQKQQDWFDAEALAVSVPEPIRYYLAQTDGQPIVSWRDPEEVGVKSQLPPGTLFANGNMVTAKGVVCAPADRRANHACEACRHSQTKCDGYGDRPCSTCIRSRKSTCVYQPWTKADQQEYQAALEHGTVSRRREVHGNSQKFRKDLSAHDEDKLSQQDKAIVQSMLTDYLPGAEVEEFQEAPADNLEVEIDVESRPQSPEEDDLPIYDAPWPSLHDAEALQQVEEDVPAPMEDVPEPASPPVAPRKRKIGNADAEPKSQPSKKKKVDSPQELIDVDTCFAGLKPVRTLKKSSDWFDVDLLPVSVPYGIRYYLMPSYGTPVVSIAAPEKPGRKSKRPEGTLFEDGSMVNPDGKVDPPAVRRANHACEMCRFSATKCDGYGDRPCSACMKSHKAVCVYQPWTEADQKRYLDDLKTGISSKVASGSRGSRRQVQLPAELLTTKADHAVLRSMLDVEEEDKVEVKPSKRRRATSEPEPVWQSVAEASPEVQLKPARAAKKKTKAEQEIIDTDACFAGLIPRRKLKVSHDWFDEEALPLSVPYTMRYYVMPRDGQPVVSSALPEEAGVKSKQPEGTMYENGNRVGPRGSVDAPVTRMAKQPCECCRFSLKKCDGYGDRPCSTCTGSRKPVCVYEPITEEEYEQFLHELEHGRRRREKVEPPIELQTTRQDRAVLEAMLDIPDEVERKSHRREEPKSSRAKSKRAASVVSEDALDIIDIEDADLEPSPPKPKRKKSRAALVRQMPRRQFDMDVSQSNEDQADYVSDPGDIYVGPVPRRYLKMPLDVFYVEDLPVSVPYPIRYYLHEDGQPVVSWRKPEPEGTRSKLLVGTLYENGNRVNPRQMVDIPADRRANHACEWCRFNLTKCDGYGDRPCSACCSLGRPVCVFRPWTTDDMRNYLIDINESPDDGRPTDSRRAFSVSKALSDLGTSLRDEVVIQSMLEAGPADAGTQEYREAIARGAKLKAKEKPKVPLPVVAESYGVEVEIPVEPVEPVKAVAVEEPAEEPVGTPRQKSKRKRGWLPPQAGADTAWAEPEQPVAGPSQPVAPPAPVSNAPSRSSRRNGKAQPFPAAESETFTEDLQVATMRKFKARRSRTGTASEADQPKPPSENNEPPAVAGGSTRKRRRIVSSTPDMDPTDPDALYAELNYPESFERSKAWARFEDVLGISDSDENDSSDGEYLYEQGGSLVGLKRTPGMRVEIELESGIGWGEEEEAHGLDFVRAIAQAVATTGSVIQHVGQRAWSAATELANGLVDVDVDDSMVEDLLP